LTKDLVD